VGFRMVEEVFQFSNLIKERGMVGARNDVLLLGGVS